MPMTPVPRITAVLLLTVILIAGCGGGGPKIQATTNKTTAGQELSGLKRAYDQGMITKDQYENSKHEILKRYDR